MSIDHYENFPVASVLCPPALRSAVSAIYWYARTADDLADEGAASPEQRLADLQAYRAQLQAAATGQPAAERWHAVFDPLRETISRHALPINLLEDLLSAFEQDVTRTRYADRADLLDYCRRSANPVGRLLLHLYGMRGDDSFQQSDAICSALQLANFWQDLSVDIVRGRLYIPTADCERHGLSADALLSRTDTPQSRALVADMVDWARDSMLSGAPLVHALPGRAGWELRLVVQGGLRILEKISKLQFATLSERPSLRWHDGPIMLWRALWTRPSSMARLRETRP